jgi:hypothetical protein
VEELGCQNLTKGWIDPGADESSPGLSVQGTERLPAARRLNTKKQWKNKCVGALPTTSQSNKNVFTDFEDKSMQKEKGMYASSYACKAQLK